MHCPHCSVVAPAESRFCPSCGRPLAPATGSEDATSLGTAAGGDEATRLAPGPRPASPSSPSSSSGWLSSSGSIDHGRFEPGSTLEGRYRILGLLGRGGMGEVYRADDLRLGQQVALKFLPESLSHDPVRLAQFHNEVRTARQVSHPNVCRVYDIGEAQRQLYLTMEYVDGEDLSSLIRRIGRLPEDKALEIARQVAAGLAAAHERGVLHRDLKPANVMLDGQGRARIMDFSLATAGEIENIRAGTPAYMAPEQLQGREVTARSDIYALGLVLYELFTGRRAFDATTIAELVAQHESGTLRPPSEIVRTLDQTVERAILRCLDPDPARRPASAIVVSAALPGGDPLAAALAAGETPSPEMVAAAGGEQPTVGPGAGAMWLGGLAALLVAAAAAGDRATVLGRVPLERAPVVLADRALEMQRAFGYDEPFADRAHGLRYDGDYLQWAVANGEGSRHWAQLGAGQPWAISSWQRTSPRPMVPYDEAVAVGISDPPMLLSGMTLTIVDTAGRLVLFRAVPPQIEPAVESVQPFDWSVAFEAAGLQMASFVAASVEWTPIAFADERRAWRGELPDLPGVPVRVETAAYRGRPVSFEIVGPWTRATRQVPFQRPETARLTGVVGVLIVTALPIGAALLARRHWKLGRADRRGAIRLGAFVFLLRMVVWVVAPVHVSDWQAETTRLFDAIAAGLFLAGMLVAAYLALEPFIRRHWPGILITWSRLLGGRVRDPFVGRDLLIGAVAGLALTVLERSSGLLPVLVGLPEPTPDIVDLSPIWSGRALVSGVIARIDWGLQNALMGALVLALIRILLVWLAGPVSPDTPPGIHQRVLRSAWTTGLLVALIFVFVSLRNTPVSSGYFWFDVTNALLLGTGIVLIILRLGLFGVAVMFWANLVTSGLPLTLDGDRLYAGSSLAIVVTVLAVAAVGLWMARAGDAVPGQQAAARAARGNA